MGKFNSNDVGGVAELVAKDEISSNAGYMRLGGSAQAMNIRVQHRRGQMKTAVVENNAGKAFPCASNPEQTTMKLNTLLMVRLVETALCIGFGGN